MNRMMNALLVVLIIAAAPLLLGLLISVLAVEHFLPSFQTDTIAGQNMLSTN